MRHQRLLGFLFGAAAGMALCAVVIGLGLVAVAVATDLQAGPSSVLTRHPLYVSGSELVVRGLLACGPLLVVWSMYRRRGRDIG